MINPVHYIAELEHEIICTVKARHTAVYHEEYGETSSTEAQKIP